MKAFDQQTLNNFITDIVDSYFIMKTGLKIALVTHLMNYTIIAV